MIRIGDVWRDERSSFDRSRAIVVSVVALGITLAGSAYLGARDDLYERMSRSYKRAELLQPPPAERPSPLPWWA